MIRLIVVTVLAALVFSVDAFAASIGTLPTGGKDTKPLPPGPHFILTVPVTLHSLPPEVDQYEVSCGVMVPGYSGYVGHGSAVGAIPKAGDNSGVDFRTDATVGIFVTKGDMVTLESVVVSMCRLYLRGTAYGVTTTYMADPEAHLLYQLGESGFPLSPGAPFIRYIRVQIPH